MTTTTMIDGSDLSHGKDGPQLDHPHTNRKLRALVTLPPVQHSASTSISVPTLPPQGVFVTGDKEVDAVLWLRDVIRTGDPTLISKALEAAKLIKTPLKDIADRYRNYLVAKNPGNWTAAFATLGFDDLEGLAKTSVEKLTRQHEARARFGDTLHDDTPAELFAIEALAGLKPSKNFGELDERQVDKRFLANPDLMPNTLNDCLYELAYWHDLYWLRNAFGCCDPGPQAYARERFVFRSLANIPARTKHEALAVYQYLKDRDGMDEAETDGILLNLIGGQP